MPNKWVEHVKQYAKKHNLSYGCAVSDPGCKSSYHAGKDVPPLETPMRTSRVIKATPPKTGATTAEKEMIDKFVEDAIKDIYYEEFPDFMKGTVSREKLYKDKFLTLSKKKQDELRNRVRQRVITQLRKTN